MITPDKLHFSMQHNAHTPKLKVNTTLKLSQMVKSLNAHLNNSLSPKLVGQILSTLKLTNFDKNVIKI